MKSFMLFSILFFYSILGMAQGHKIFEIKEVAIKDTTLIKIIDEFSDAKMASDSLYRAGLGYLIISAVNHSQKSPTGSKQSFYLNIDYFDFLVQLKNEVFLFFFNRNFS